MITGSEAQEYTTLVDAIAAVRQRDPRTTFARDWIEVEDMNYAGRKFFKLPFGREQEEDRYYESGYIGWLRKD